jgi:tripartite ATP-independent transporter DctP family solute receptor
VHWDAAPFSFKGETMNRRSVIELGVAGVVVAAAKVPRVFAQAKLELKASDVHPAGYPTVVAVENFGKRLEQATNGRISVRMFPSMQLGGEKEAIEQAQVGAIQLARVSVGALGPAIDELNVFSLPFLFRDTAHMQRVVDGSIGQELLDKITNNEKAGVVGLCWMDAGARSMYSTTKPIKSIGDLKGMKMRVMGNPMFVDMLNALGGNGVAMGYDQVFTALQTGVVDGAENNPPSFVFDNHFSVAKYYTLTEHLIVPEVLVLSKKTWDSLNKDEQAMVLQFAREAQLDERRLWQDYEKAAIEKAKAAGTQIIEVADKRRFRWAVSPVWEKYGPRFREMIIRIQDVN